MRQNKINIRGTVNGKKVIISPATIVVAYGCAYEGLVFDKDYEKGIT